MTCANCNSDLSQTITFAVGDGRFVCGGCNEALHTYRDGRDTEHYRDLLAERDALAAECAAKEEERATASKAGWRVLQERDSAREALAIETRNANAYAQERDALAARVDVLTAERDAAREAAGLAQAQIGNVSASAHAEIDRVIHEMRLEYDRRFAAETLLRAWLEWGEQAEDDTRAFLAEAP